VQDGCTPVYKASEDGHTETVALLLANKADINAANNVQHFIIFKYLKVIDNKVEDFNIASFILSTILVLEITNYYVCRTVLPQRL
jgi:hypothetical protein